MAKTFKLIQLTARTALFLWLAGGIGAHADLGYRFSPSNIHPIVPPYADADIAGKDALAGVQFQMTKCEFDRTDIRLFQKSVKVYRPNRETQVLAPSSLDLSDARIVNRLIVSAWKVAWKNCSSNYVQGSLIYTDYSRVTVVVLQNNNPVIVAEPTAVSVNGSIGTTGLVNRIAEKQARAKKEEPVAQANQNDEQIVVTELPAPSPGQTGKSTQTVPAAGQTGNNTLTSKTTPEQDASSNTSQSKYFIDYILSIAVVGFTALILVVWLLIWRNKKRPTSPKNNADFPDSTHRQSGLHSVGAGSRKTHGTLPSRAKLEPTELDKKIAEAERELQEVSRELSSRKIGITHFSNYTNVTLESG